MKKLLIIYHSKDGSTAKMADAVYKGAKHPDVDVSVRMLLAKDAFLEDLLWANGVIFGTPENFGYMSGALKDFFDRTYYPAEGKVEGMPYCIFICAGNDGAGALRSIERIVKGYPLKKIQEPLISKGELSTDLLEACEEFGLYMSAGIESSIF
ncbi:MAG: multimeric flavodoxin WrbA [Candidatus Azotimanducaceae bacterium]|jgi:multimeric flavodoxin WrbA